MSRHSLQPTQSVAADPFVARAVFPPGAGTTGTLTRHVLGLTTAGDVTYCHGNDKVTVRSGGMLLVEPNTPQQWRAGQSAGWQCVYCIFTIRPAWAALLRYPRTMPGHAPIPLDEMTYRRVRHCLLRMLAVQQLVNPMRDALAANLLEQGLLWCQAYQRARMNPLDDRVRAALDELHQHMTRPWSLTKLARRCHSSRARLAALFHEQVGRPPMTYLQHQRLDRAAELLRFTAMSVRQVAETVGFEDPKHFSKRFCKHHGCSPRAYRLRYM